MKVSLAWLFDHIEGDWRDCDVAYLVRRFNEVTAEIESWHRVSYNLDSFDLVPDSSCTDSYFLVKKQTGECLRYSDIGSDKGGELGAVSLPKHVPLAVWRDYIEQDDVIFEVDNKSLTHRPDMWGHRGFAREVAALLGLRMKSEEEMLAHIPEKISSTAHQMELASGLVVENRAVHACDRISVMELAAITPRASDLRMAFRLARVGVRFIDLLVDLTNYVMLDTSQPMHAFDAVSMTGKKLQVRMAHDGEQLRLLDERDVTLLQEDLVVANAERAMGLAGVMGGQLYGVKPSTQSVIIESAHFSPDVVRKMALRHKTRTEASARFEKKLDPNQITTAQKRFAFLAQHHVLVQTLPTEIVCIGAPMSEPTIQVSHEYLVSRSGIALSPQDVIAMLQPLDFRVQYAAETGLYHITIPSFRAAKDVVAPEDILEEVVRSYGFNRIVPELPTMIRPASCNMPQIRERRLKTVLCDALGMSEICSYAMFNEEVLRTLGIENSVYTQHGDTHPVTHGSQAKALELLNPVSSQYVRMCTSLVPALLASVMENTRDYTDLGLFELARVWSVHGTEVHERQSLAGVLCAEAQQLGFYEGKAKLEVLFAAMNMHVIWERAHADTMPFWAYELRTARLMHEGVLIGYAGLINRELRAKLDAASCRELFIFELNADRILSFEPAVIRFKPLPRYPTSTFDLSFMAPYTATTHEFEKVLQASSELVRRVMLVDMFEKREWVNTRALAFRVEVGSDEHTLSGEEIERARQAAIDVATTLGATLRGV